MRQQMMLPLQLALEQPGVYVVTAMPQRAFIPQRLVCSDQRIHEFTIEQLDIAGRLLFEEDASVPGEVFSPVAIGTQLTGAGACNPGSCIRLRFTWRPEQQRQPLYVPKRIITRKPRGHWLRRAWWVTTQARHFRALLVGEVVL